MVVRFEPCGNAKARFIGPDRTPVAKLRPMLEILTSPGPNPAGRACAESRSQLMADSASVGGSIDSEALPGWPADRRGGSRHHALI